MTEPLLSIRGQVAVLDTAGNLILRHMGKLDALNVFEKSKQDYASEVDSQAEAEIIRELRRAFPRLEIIGYRERPSRDPAAPSRTATLVARRPV